MKRILVVLAILLVAIAAFLWTGSDRRRIEKALDRLESACDKSGPDSPVSMLSRNRTIVGSFAPGFLVSAQPYQGTFTDAQELARAIEVYRASSRTVTVRDSGRQLEIGRDGTAEMETVFVVSGQGGGGPGTERFRAKIFWVRHEDEWKIRELTIVEIVERGALQF